MHFSKCILSAFLSYFEPNTAANNVQQINSDWYVHQRGAKKKSVFYQNSEDLLNSLDYFAVPKYQTENSTL